MTLREKYAFAIDTAKTLKMQGSADEREGQLFFHGTVATQDEANQIWNAIKTVPEWPKEIVADIKANGTAVVATTGTAAPTTYTVKAGDTLSKIAGEFLGDPKAFMDIFEANKGLLTDPNRITVGQVLKIPQLLHR